MGLIREPLDVDFYVIDRPLTDKDRKEISAYIQNCKKKKRLALKRTRTRTKAKTEAK